MLAGAAGTKSTLQILASCGYAGLHTLSQGQVWPRKHSSMWHTIPNEAPRHRTLAWWICAPKVTGEVFKSITYKPHQVRGPVSQSCNQEIGLLEGILFSQSLMKRYPPSVFSPNTSKLHCLQDHSTTPLISLN